MYELWLALNILFELALMYLPIVLTVAVLWVVIMAIAFKRGQGKWSAAIRPAILSGLAVTFIGVLAIPGLTLSSLSELKYWVDWANLVAVAGGFGTVAAAFALPIAAASLQQPPSSA